MSFDKLSKKELLRTLDEDFAFDLTDEEKATKATVLAAVSEGKLRFADYLIANPHQKEKFAQKESDFVTGGPVTAPVNTEVNGVVVKDNTVTEAPWLVKMERENSLYEVGKYRFTKTHPFVLVAANDVQKVLLEGGFRQAYPAEADEYYG